MVLAFLPVPELTSPRGVPPRLSVAPMVDRTDRHFRWLLRGITRRTLLYTEMVVARGVVDARARAQLRHDACERPLSLQLGGRDPATLARAARIGEDEGFDEVNLNCGCPSPAALAGGFGAALMLEPERMAEAVAAMRAAVKVPVTVKLRLGVDGRERFDELVQLCDGVAEAGVDRVIVHARVARLRGLSPAANRVVPPLRPDWVSRLAAMRPRLRVELNGGLRDLDDVHRAIAGSEIVGAMIGRAAWDDPMILAKADSSVFGADDPGLPASAVLRRMIPYAEAWVQGGGDPRAPWRGALHLLRGIAGARRLRGELATRGDVSGLVASL